MRLFGEVSPDWNVFPRIKRSAKPDPTRPMTTWRSAWKSLTKAAGLSGLRFHDLRHHCITELSEGQTSDSTIMEIAGHVSPRMLRHYSHIRMQAKRRALDGLSGGGNVTKRVTRAANPASEMIPSNVFNDLGGDDEQELAREHIISH